jgi:hypothetical protein
MATDKSNLQRVDLIDIFKECERRTAFKYRAIATEISSDAFVIGPDEYEQMLSFILEAAARLSSQINYIQHAGQTGLDALSWINGTDKPYAEDGENDKVGAYLSQNEKLHQKGMCQILFEYDSFGDFENEQNRYSVTQEFIKAALIHYVLYKWYLLIGFRNEATEEYLQYETNLVDIRSGAVAYQRNKGAKKKYRFY